MLDKKYDTKNPIVRHLINNFIKKISAQIDKLQPKRIIDLGCGTGYAIKLIKSSARHTFDYLGFDICLESLARARLYNPDLQFIQKDLLQNPFHAEPGDLIICLEVIEHFEHPIALLAVIREMQAENVILSVPWEPFFSIGNLLRGRNLSRLGDNPEHLQHFNPTKFSKLISDFYVDYQIATSFPWIICHCRQ